MLPDQNRAEVDMAMAARLKPETIAPDLGIPERMMLFCLASGIDWERVGVPQATAQHLLLLGLIDQGLTSQRFRLTPLGLDVIGALLKPLVDEQDG